MQNTALGLKKPELTDNADLLVFIGQNMDLIDSLLQGRFTAVANSGGTVQFSAAPGKEAIQFAGSGASSVTFSAATNRVTISSTNTTYSQGTGITISGTTINNTDRGSSQFIFKNIANSAGTTQFSAETNTDTIRFAGTGSVSVSFNSGTKTVTIGGVDNVVTGGMKISVSTTAPASPSTNDLWIDMSA